MRDAGQDSVSVINGSREIAELVAAHLERAGFATSVGSVWDFKRARPNFAEFVAVHDPRVLVWDVAAPYEANWRYLREARASPAGQGRRFVLTTPNQPVLTQLIGAHPALEIVGEAFDLDRIVMAVRQILTGRLGRSLDP